MRYRILGTTEVAGEPVHGNGLRALLAALLLESGRPVSAERLREIVYGGGGGAPNALQSQVSRLRKLAPVERVDTGYRLAVDPEEVDAHRFARLAAEGRRAGRTPEAVRLLGEALALWRGEEALADLPGLEAQRERLARLRADAVENRIEAELELKADPARLIEELRALAAGDPLRERPRALLIRALAATGRHVEALECYEEYRGLLAEALGTSPSPELRRLHVAVLRGEHVRRPMTAMPGPPRPVSSFVGREEELTDLRRLLKEHRLVTLIGPGGSGKTRLAAEAVAGDGEAVCFVELAPADGARQAVRRALGGGDRLGGDPLQALPATPLLLVLDNCEHLIEECAALAARILAAAPATRVLATSREPLGVDGEVTLPVHPLALPVEGAGLPEALTSPAVSLLVDRARAADPHFVPSEAVVRVCRSLDGLPLAIELAAARLRALTADDLAERLETRLHGRFDLLASGHRGTEERHRTLRAVVAWSWELLSEDEQRLAARLSAFPSGATLKAAEQICGATPALLAALVDKSLVHAGHGRYRMLETVRAFCAERLEPDEEDAVRQAHATYFAALAAAAEPALRSHRQVHALAELAAEHDNLHAALRWAIGQEHTELAVRMAASLWLYWWMRGMADDSSQLAAAAVALPGAEERAEHFLMAVLHLASTGNPRSGLGQLMIRAERLAEGLGPVPDYPMIQMVRPFTAIAEGDFAALLPALRTGATSAEPWSRGFAHLVAALVRLGTGGQVEQADRDLRAALTAFRLAGDRWGAGQSLLQLAEIAGWRGDNAAELRLTEEAMALSAAFGVPEDTGPVLAQRGVARARTGDIEGAKTDLRRAVELARVRNSVEMESVAVYALAEVARIEGDDALAVELYERALAGCGSLLWVGEEDLRARILVGLGLVTGDEGLLREAFGLMECTLDVPVAAGAVEAMAELALRSGAADRAAELLGAAGALRGMTRHEAAEVEEAARRVLGDAASERARGRGAGLDREGIAALMSAPRASAVSAVPQR
ncbi:ATP-binding protein [Nonomuraea typhae]|uniref:ATP-binding protein n=1 Tax=Nonomuraea typhae TaxID=2603600 RepID=A0ABW7YL90_9ACTN